MGRRDPFATLGSGMERRVQDAAGKQCAFDRVGWSARMHHPLDRLEQIREVRIPRFAPFVECRRPVAVAL